MAILGENAPKRWSSCKINVRPTKKSRTKRKKTVKSSNPSKNFIFFCVFERKNFESQKVYYWSKRTKRNVRESTDNTRIKIAQNHFGCFLFAADSTMCNPLLAIYLKQCLYTILICYFVVILLLFVWMFQTPAWFLSVQHSYHLGSEEKTHRIRLRTLVDKRWWWSWSRNVCRLKGKGTTEIKMSARRRFQVKK